MKIELSRESSIPLKAQLALQIEVSIVTGQYAPGEKLPSVRELARRLKLHHNTVAAAYQELTRRGLIESQRGSGIYVRNRSIPRSPEDARELDELIASFVKLAQDRGYTGATIREAVRKWLDLQPPDHVLIVEPAPDIRKILAHELAGALPCPVESASLEETRESKRLDGALVVTSFYHSSSVREIVGATVPLVVMNLNPGEAELERLHQLPIGAMLGIVSISPMLLTTVAMVIASIRGEDLMIRPVPFGEEREWRRLARTADAMICDSIAGARVGPVTRHTLRIIKMVPESTLEELRSYFQTGNGTASGSDRLVPER